MNTLLRVQLATLAAQAGRASLPGLRGERAATTHGLPMDGTHRVLAGMEPGALDAAARERLRLLVAQRQRRACGELPGAEVSPGLHRIEQVVPGPPLAAVVQPPWLGEIRINAARLVFLDTETTGLAGGTGTKAFMVGVARIEGDSVRVTQWLLTRIAGEAAMLDALTAALPTDSVLVTYNGKSFDLPLLRTRYRMNRQHEPFGDALHLDLLHPVRRIYRHTWPNCRLVTVEERLLGHTRVDDLPGSEAPAAWRSFLTSGATGLLRRVLDHNARDLVSLVHVLGRLSDSTR